MFAARLALVIVVVVAFLLAALSVSRRLRQRRDARAARAAVVPLARPQAARGMAAPVQPSGEERKPFTYGGIVAIEDEEGKS